MTMVTKSVKVDEAAWLNAMAYAGARGLTVSDLVREAIAAYTPVPDTRRVQVLMSFDVDAIATDADIDAMVWAAGVQIEEPVDTDGSRAEFSTSRLHTEWEWAQ